MRSRDLLATIVSMGLIGTAATAQPPAAPGAPLKGAAPTTTNTQQPQYLKEYGGLKLEDWVKKLDPSFNRDAAVRELAVRTIPHFGPDAVKYLPKIIDRLNDDDYAVKSAALLVCTSNPIEDKKLQERILNNLKNMIGSQHVPLRIQAAQAAARVGPEAVAVVPDLLRSQIRFSNSYEVRKAGVQALGAVARPPDDRAPTKTPELHHQALLALLGRGDFTGYGITDPCLAVRIEAVQSLIYLGQPTLQSDLDAEKKILDERVLKEKDRALVLWLRVCYMRLAPELITDKYLDPLAAGLRDADQHVRIAAAQAMAMMGPGAKSKAGALRVGLELANSTKPEDREFLFYCLGAISNMGADAIFLKNEIKNLTLHTDQAIRQIAIDIVNKLEGKKN